MGTTALLLLPASMSGDDQYNLSHAATKVMQSQSKATTESTEQKVTEHKREHQQRKVSINRLVTLTRHPILDQGPAESDVMRRNLRHAPS